VKSKSTLVEIEAEEEGETVELLPQQQVNIPLMGSGDLRSAIEKPAQNAKLSFSPPELVDRILNDVGSEEGRLPLLQLARVHLLAGDRGRGAVDEGAHDGRGAAAGAAREGGLRDEDPKYV
jgi:hypothetical protein